MRHYKFSQSMLRGLPGNITPAAKSVIPRALNGGLVVTATTNGTHAPSSYHYRGMAVDFGVEGRLVGTAEARKREVRFQRFLLRKFGPDAFYELIGPDNNAIVLQGRKTTLAEGSALETQHDNHVHVAPRRVLPAPQPRPGDRTLHPGMHGSDVKAAMKALQKRGFFPKSRKLGKTYGHHLHVAVNAFKHKHKLPRDGAIGSRVWKLLGR